MAKNAPVREFPMHAGPAPHSAGSLQHGYMRLHACMHACYAPPPCSPTPSTALHATPLAQSRRRSLALYESLPFDLMESINNTVLMHVVCTAYLGHLLLCEYRALSCG
eukprot:COSAG01_NODE_449_length_16915_cov_23.001903_9_plen_108_part_00